MPARLCLLTALAIPFVAACDRGPARPASASASTTPRAAPAGRRNLIIISLDTLRADRLGCYGYTRPTSPAIDAFAEESTRFTHVISESCWTLPSHMTLFTALYPTTHGVTTPGASLSKRIQTLPEILQQRGYQTFAYTGGGYLAKYYGFGRGFDRYIATGNHGLQPALEHANDQLDRLEPNDRFFMFIHAYDLHAPYTSGLRFASRFTSPDAEPFPNWQRNEIQFKEDGLQLTPGNIRFLSDQYDAGIRQTDQRLAPFLTRLKDQGRFDDTVIVILSDHGEEFGEHGFLGHRGSLHRECLEPPLIVHVPGVKPRVVDHGVGLRDVLPTMLDLLKIPAPPRQGRSLVPLLRGDTLDPWPLFSEVDTHGHFRAVVWEGKHLIIKAYDPRPRLYDWTTDPTEQTNLAQTQPDWVRTLLDKMPHPPESYLHPDSTPTDHLTQLRSLGYVETDK